MGSAWSNSQRRQVSNTPSMWRTAGQTVMAATAAAAVYKIWQSFQGGRTSTPQQETTDFSNDGSLASGGQFDLSSESDSGIETYPTKECLSFLLNQFYTNYAQIPQGDLKFASNIVDEVQQMFVKFIRTNYGKFQIGELEHFGSMYEGLGVIKPHVFDIMLPLRLEENMWEVTDALDTLLEIPGYWFVQRKNLDFFTKGSSVWDECLVGGYLCPLKVVKLFQTKIQQGINWQCKYNILPALTGTSITLWVDYQDQVKSNTIQINFYPSLKIDGINILAKMHPLADENQSYQNLWLQVYVHEEKQLLKDMDSRDQGCRHQCLMILKALRLSNSPLYMLQSYVLKTLLLHISRLDDEEDWSKDKLSERFIDMLKILEQYLRDRVMSDFFNPDVNLLAYYHHSDLGYLEKYISGIIRKNKMPSILQHVLEKLPA